MVASEHYNRIVAAARRQRSRSRLELNVQNRFVDDTLDSFNIVAEIPGTDKADEIVMLGAHFDSWHAGTGATDNAAGVGGDDGGDADSEDLGRAAAAHGAPRALDGRGAGAARLDART